MNPSESTVSGIPDYVLKRAMKPWPEYARKFITSKSTCVTSFGDPSISRIATIGINPTTTEFLDRKSRSSDLAGSPIPLPQNRKRFVDYEILNKSEGAPLDVEEAMAVVRKCQDYFKGLRTPFFTSLEENVLKNISKTFVYGENAVHLDIVQWSTQIAWNEFRSANPEVATKLLEEDLLFLERQVKENNFDIVYLNGQTVMSELKKIMGEELDLRQFSYSPSERMPSKRSSGRSPFLPGVYSGFFFDKKCVAYTGFVGQDRVKFNPKTLQEELPKIAASWDI